MKDLETVLLDMEKLRSELYRLIDTKDDLHDKSILDMSQKLDLLINKYNNLIK